jgi:hypothetical protein
MATREKRLRRPALAGGQRLAKNRTFRIRDGLDKTLGKSAKAAQRSISEEIEHALSTYYYDARTQSRLLGSEAASEILRLIRGVMVLEGIEGNDWIKDKRKAERLRCAVNVILAIVGDLPVDLPLVEPPAGNEKAVERSADRQEGNMTAANLLAKSSFRRRMPGWLQFLVERAPAGQGDRERTLSEGAETETGP